MIILFIWLLLKRSLPNFVHIRIPPNRHVGLQSSVFSGLHPIAARRAKLEGECDLTIGVVQTEMVWYITSKNMRTGLKSPKADRRRHSTDGI